MTDFLEYIFPPEHFSGVVDSFERGITIIFMCCFLIVAAAFMDMWVGVDAAKAAKEPLMSRGLRRTLTKVLDYLRVLMFAILIDILGAFFTWYHLPYLSILSTLAILLIEGRSVVENFHRKKSNAAEVIDWIGKIRRAVSDKDAKEILEAIKKEKSLYDKSKNEYNGRKDS